MPPTDPIRVRFAWMLEEYPIEPPPILDSWPGDLEG